MADLFASSKQPSLFPLTTPVIRISKNEYRAFYKDERALFRILLELLHRDVVESRLVMGFLLWLERQRYTSYSLSKMFVNSMTPDVINLVADEVVICIKFLQKKANNFISEGSSKSYNISHLQYFLDRKCIHLEDLYHNGDLLFHEVSCIANDISVKAFDDILEQFIRHGEIRYQHQQMVPPDDRTIFLTFSKGYPISEDEIIQYFTSMFGDFIQSLHMQPVDEQETQSLFARVVVRNPSFVRAVIERDGPHGKSKYIINGKHVWARKFVPRTPYN
ncbi:hypothetical protein L1987_42422 [Smallanthus sonchifolius]|uniref:Uncharacterized protein n=1 Tax=Smallanthus sonchifolius TaxID=185202 RepID=A0ACB9GJJ7_9ASTR|nr:hypothetical protein L1987_42422 [Smallanthus sonchifolius]